jgi:hypothetical protein
MVSGRCYCDDIVTIHDADFSPTCSRPDDYKPVRLSLLYVGGREKAKAKAEKGVALTFCLFTLFGREDDGNSGAGSCK